MTQNNNLTPLAFYQSIDEQNSRKSYAFGEVYPLYVPQGHILPFQILSDQAFTNVRIYLHDGNTGVVVAEITNQMADTGLSYAHIENQYVMIYTGNLPLNVNFQIGRYYLRITASGKTYFSDLFTSVDDVSGYLKIEWWDNAPLIFDSGLIAYGAPAHYKNRIYLATELGRPEYDYREEGAERDGYFFPTMQISEKTYKFTFPASEYMLDAMRFIRLSDHIRITDKYGHIYNADTFLITPRWQERAILAIVDAEFQTNTAVKKTGLGMIPSGLGDYNDDYNDDYLK